MKNNHKILFIFLAILFLSQPVFAGSINAAAYKTMQAQTYRNNYRTQVRQQNMPYWQVQSNFATRNRVYRNYSNYTRHMNNATYTNYGNQFYRGRF